MSNCCDFCRYRVDRYLAVWRKSARLAPYWRKSARRGTYCFIVTNGTVLAVCLNPAPGGVSCASYLAAFIDSYVEHSANRRSQSREEGRDVTQIRQVPLAIRAPTPRTRESVCRTPEGFLRSRKEFESSARLRWLPHTDRNRLDFANGLGPFHFGKRFFRSFFRLRWPSEAWFAFAASRLGKWIGVAYATGDNCA